VFNKANETITIAPLAKTITVRATY